MTPSQAIERLQELYRTAGQPNSWEYSELERLLTELKSFKTGVVQRVGFFLGLHGKSGKKDTIERIRHRIGESKYRGFRGEVIAKAAAKKTEEVYDVEEVN